MNTGSDVMFKEEASIIYLLLIKLLNYKVYLYLNISDSFQQRYEKFSINAAIFNNHCFQEVFTININIFSEGFKQKCRAVSAISAHMFQMFSNST